MTARWQTTSIADIVDRTETVDPQRAPETEFLYIDVSSVSNRTFRVEEPRVLLGKNAPGRARRRVRSGDIIFATVRPTLQRVALIPPELDGQVCSTGFVVLRPRPGIDSRFVFYWLLTGEFKTQNGRSPEGGKLPCSYRY